jgi:hypothetical protein
MPSTKIATDETCQIVTLMKRLLVPFTSSSITLRPIFGVIGPISPDLFLSFTFYQPFYDKIYSFLFYRHRLLYNIDCLFSSTEQVKMIIFPSKKETLMPLKHEGFAKMRSTFINDKNLFLKNAKLTTDSFSTSSLS